MNFDPVADAAGSLAHHVSGSTDMSSADSVVHQNQNYEDRHKAMNQEVSREAWLEQFAGYLEVERNYSSHTIRAYMNDLKQFIESDSETPSISQTSPTDQVIEDSESGTASSGWLAAEGLRSYIRQIQEQYSPHSSAQDLGNPYFLSLSPPRTTDRRKIPPNKYAVPNSLVSCQHAWTKKSFA